MYIINGKQLLCVSSIFYDLYFLCSISFVLASFFPSPPSVIYRKESIESLTKANTIQPKGSCQTNPEGGRTTKILDITVKKQLSPHTQKKKKSSFFRTIMHYHPPRFLFINTKQNYMSSQYYSFLITISWEVHILYLK